MCIDKYRERLIVNMYPSVSGLLCEKSFYKIVKYQEFWLYLLNNLKTNKMLKQILKITINESA